MADYQSAAVCDAVIVAQAVVAKKDHIPSDWITDAQATYVENGSRHKICLLCEDTLENEIIPSILKYTLLSDGTYEVSGFGGDGYTDVVIPSEYNGKPITSIGNSAFANTKVKLSMPLCHKAELHLRSKLHYRR